MRKVRYEPPSGQVLETRLGSADKDGEHMWVMLASWSIPDPAKAKRAFSENLEDTIFLDRENLLTFAGPGCYKCEAEYTPALAARPCTGSQELQP